MCSHTNRDSYIFFWSSLTNKLYILVFGNVHDGLMDFLKYNGGYWGKQNHLGELILI